jgi:hypothetical protein
MTVGEKRLQEVYVPLFYILCKDLSENKVLVSGECGASICSWSLFLGMLLLADGFAVTVIGL